jgi:hypothetical protein
MRTGRRLATLTALQEPPSETVMSSLCVLTPTRLPGLRAAIVRTAERLGMHRPLKPAPLMHAVALLAACAAGVLIALGPAPAEAGALTAIPAEAGALTAIPADAGALSAVAPSAIDRSEG